MATPSFPDLIIIKSHLLVPKPCQSAGERKQNEALNKAAAMANEKNQQILLCGDLNGTQMHNTATTTIYEAHWLDENSTQHAARDLT